MSNADRKYNLGLKADYEGVMDFMVAAGTTASCDFVIPYIKYISGIQLILDGQEFGDQVWFQIIGDIPNETVLDQFGEHWYVDPDNRAQQLLVPDNVQAKLDPADAPNLRLRVKYKSVGLVDVRVLANVIFDVESA